MNALAPNERKLLFNAFGVAGGLAIGLFSEPLEGVILQGICWIVGWAAGSAGASGLIDCADITGFVVRGVISSMLVVVGLAIAIVCIVRALFTLMKITREKREEAVHGSAIPKQ